MTTPTSGTPHDHLRALAEAATPTQQAEHRRYDHGGGRLMIVDHPTIDRTLIADFYNEADRDFYMSVGPETVIALLDELQQARGEIERLRGAMHIYAKHKSNCAITQFISDSCTCGLEEVLK